MEKSRVLVVGGTGYIGRRLVRASLAQGHPTLVLMRPEIGLDINKLQMLLSFKAQGARLVEASLEDHAALVAAVAQADVVVSAMSGDCRSHNLSLQHKLVDAIKEAGNIKRFIPSEFGMDPSKMGHALEPGRVTFVEKMDLRRAIEDANIPHTYVSANCFAGKFCANLCQMRTLLPPKEKVHVYGDGNVKAIFCDEDDAATYTIKSVDDPRALNKTIYIRPEENILTQNDVISKWEKLSGNVMEKVHIPADEFLASMKDSSSLWPQLLQEAHDAGHEGVQKTSSVVISIDSFRILFAAVQFANRTKLSIYTRLDYYSRCLCRIMCGVWSDITMDFVEGFPHVGGKSVVISVVDRFSKMAHFIALSHPYSARSVGRAFFQSIVCFHGFPCSIVTDRDTVFTSIFLGGVVSLGRGEVAAQLCFSPQTDGQSEVTNRIIVM